MSVAIDSAAFPREIPSLRTTRGMVRHAGFTLVELVMVLVIVGVLAVAVVPRFLDRADYDARGFADATLAALHYAQKTAIAQRREVCVTFTANSVALKIASNYSSTATGVCANNLAGNPDGSAAYSVAATGSVVYSPIPATFSFIPSGGTNLGATLTIQVWGSSRILTVDPVTGYAY